MTQPVSSITNGQFSLSLDMLFNCIIDGLRFKMSINYKAIVERYPFMNEVVGSSIFRCEIFSLLDKKKLSMKVGSQEPTHRKVGSKPHLAPRGFLSKVGPTCSNSHRIVGRWFHSFIDGLPLAKNLSVPIICCNLSTTIHREKTHQ